MKGSIRQRLRQIRLPRFRLSLRRVVMGIAVTLAALAALDWHIRRTADPVVVEHASSLHPAYTGLVLGARVSPGGTPSWVLAARLDSAIELYRLGKVRRLLLSGDHGQRNYDEVNNMKRYLLKRGIPERDVFLDHAGFDTYNSIVRARDIFRVSDVIIVTQGFHLRRAVYIARKSGLNVQGYIAPMPDLRARRLHAIRESLANVKAVAEVLVNRKPHFGGPPIPITGDSKLSYD